jgi:hypothetical protein
MKMISKLERIESHARLAGKARLEGFIGKALHHEREIEVLLTQIKGDAFKRAEDLLQDVTEEVSFAKFANKK